MTESESLPPNQTFEDFVGSVKTKCGVLVKDVFPKKIEELNKLLDESEDFNWDAQQKLICDEASTRDDTTDAPVLCSSVLSNQIKILKPYMVELVEHANQMKLWVKILIPKVEGGNNFGVEIQETALVEVVLIEKQAALYYKTSELYHSERAQILEELTKYPEVDDYRRAVKEWDEKHLFWLRILLSEMRNHYAALYDFTAKNLDKIIVPKASNFQSLY